MRAYLLNLKLKGMKNIYKEIKLSFYKPDLKNFNSGKYRVKGIFGRNGIGKTALVKSVEIVKNIVNPPIETTGTESKKDSTEQEENKEDNKEEEKTPLTDKERILQMLEICSNMEGEDIKNKIVNVFQKALKALER